MLVLPVASSAIGKFRRPEMRSPAKYRPEIDGLRAIAIVPVVLFHSGSRWFSGGFVGVDVFFVISGFLIGSGILAELERGEFEVLAFYRRRVRRIIPALAFVVACCVPFAVAWMLPWELTRFGDSVGAAGVFASNIYFWKSINYFAPSADEQPLLHFWSLAVEEQYYVFFPIFLMFMWRFWRRGASWLTLGAAFSSLLLAEWGWRHSPVANFYLLPTRAWELLAGALLAFPAVVAARTRAQGGRVPNFLSITGLVVILGSIATFKSTTPFPSLWALLPVGGSVLVICFSDSTNWAGRLLSSRPLVSIGLVSYSLYLWHQPLLAFSRIYPVGPQGSLGGLLPVSMSLVLAWATWRYVETPFRSASKLSSPLLFGFSCLAALALGGTALVVVAEKYRTHLPTYLRATAVATPELLAYAEKKETRFECFGRVVPDSRFESCVLGKPGARTSVIIWGDSYAGALLSGADKFLREQGSAGVAFVASGCPPVLGLQNFQVESCSDDVHLAILQAIVGIEGNQPVVVFGNLDSVIRAANVAIDGRQGTLEVLREKLTIVRKTLAAGNKRLVLLEQPPTFVEDPAPFYLRDLLRGAKRELVVDAREHAKVLSPLRSLKDRVDLYIESADFFCHAGACPSRDEAERLIFYDTRHFTKEYSERFVRVVFPQLEMH